MDHATLTSTLMLTLDRPGKESVQIAIDLGPEYAAVPAKEAIAFGPIPVASFEQAVEILKRRELTLSAIKDAAAQLGHRLADYLADEGGWHGEKRREDAINYPKRN